jgi:protein-disulfide isomerase
MYPKLTKKYFNKKYLIAGNVDAKHTIVLFSDPLCPICTGVVPEIIRDVKKHPSKIALYYIHMPLDMHPTARMLVKASILAQRQGIKDIDYKVYTANFDDSFDAYRERDKQKVLDIFNKKFNTKITMKQINAKELEDEVKYTLKLAEDALVNGTPTLFFDGEIDTMRDKYLQYIK